LAASHHEHEEHAQNHFASHNNFSLIKNDRTVFLFQTAQAYSIAAIFANGISAEMKTPPKHGLTSAALQLCYCERTFPALERILF